MEKRYLDVEDLQVYQKLCQLHIEVCDPTHDWPHEGTAIYQTFRDRYKECIRMLNGLEKTLERKLPEQDRRWQVAEARSAYDVEDPLCPPGWPAVAET